MRIEIPQIFWHGNRDRIMSIDFYPNTNYLVTSGAESENKMYVKLWRIEEVLIDSSNSNQIQGQPNLQSTLNNPINQNQEDQNNNINLLFSVFFAYSIMLSHNTASLKPLSELPFSPINGLFLLIALFRRFCNERFFISTILIL